MVTTTQSVSFFDRRKAFVLSSSRIGVNHYTEKQEEWKEKARNCLSKDDLQAFLDQIEVKTSQDGILEIGFLIAEKCQTENPLMYAPTLQGFQKRKKYLKELLEQLKKSQS